MDKPETDQILIHQVSETDDLELVRGVRVRREFPRHFHRKYYIGIVETGVRRCFYRGGNHTVHPGEVMVFRPGEVHQCTAPDGEHSYRFIGLNASWFEHRTGLNTPLPTLPGLIVSDGRMAVELIKLFDLLTGAHSDLTKETALTVFISYLLKYWNEFPAVDRFMQSAAPLRTARAHLESHFAENVSLQELSRIANLSPYHFVRSFSRVFGLPPHMYQNQYRILKAKSLIIQGKPLGEIGPAVGFYDQSHFIRQFKRFIGVKPGEYQKQIG